MFPPIRSNGADYCIASWTCPAGTSAYIAFACISGLFSRWRLQQARALCDRIDRMVPHSAPLVIAGDFNDWRERLSRLLRERLDVHEVFESTRGRPARSFPAGLPLLSLDRIYVRGMRVKSARMMHGKAWARLSDHAALSAHVSRR